LSFPTLKTSSKSGPKLISTPIAAAKHLEKNLTSLGLLNVSARPLAREVLVAAPLGQLLLFCGSLAEAIAEACAVSLTGDEPKRVSVTIGSTGPLAWPDEFVHGTGAVLIHGVNRSCLSSYGDPLRKLLTDRVLGRPVGQLPLLLGTLLDGPSTLPLGPVMTE